MMPTEAKHTMFPRGILTKMISQCLTGTQVQQTTNILVAQGTYWTNIDCKI